MNRSECICFGYKDSSKGIAEISFVDKDTGNTKILRLESDKDFLEILNFVRDYQGEIPEDVNQLLEVINQSNSS